MQSSNGQLIALPAGSHFPKQGNAQIVQQQVFIDFVILVQGVPYGRGLGFAEMELESSTMANQPRELP